MELSGVSYWTSCLAALALHELAHVAMARTMGLKVKRVGISWKGPYIVRESGAPLVNAYVAIAGPILNLSLAIVFMQLLPTFALVNLVLGLFNLLPIKSSDGRRALNCWKEANASGHAESMIIPPQPTALLKTR